MLPEPAEWTLYAACLNDNVDNYFTTDGLNSPKEQHLLKRAKCNGCPVRRNCLEDALVYPDEDDAGIFGGTTSKDRNYIRSGGHHPAHDIPYADVEQLAAVRSRTHLEIVNA